ncbi:MAG: kinase [Geobacter sp.]|nr:MAG: kinase [Geobacter sp.]
MVQQLLKSLLIPEAYPEPTFSVRLLQTHVSFIFVTDNFVYKIKKPVDFGFLNFTTIDRRRFYCNEEVRLNRRLCPEIYLGVVEVRETPAGATFCGEGRVIDYAVRMKRLPEERMLDRMLAEEKVTAADIRKIARTVAEFHLHAEHGGNITEYGSIDNIRRNWDENFQQVNELVGISPAKRDLGVIRKWSETFLAENGEIFSERAARGFIRECDGDLHLENICLTDRVCIFDCIEFNDRFRYIDTAADIAFFLMDLDYHGKRIFSDIFLDEYTAATGDRECLRVLDFYKAYRAVVRGKVESLKLLDPHIPEAEKNRVGDKAGRYFRLARGYVVRSGLRPSLIITCGLTGSGKSATAAALAFSLGTEIASSDAVRKDLAKTPRNKRRLDEYGTGIYTPAFDEATYRELLARAEQALEAGRSIIVDATFRRKGDRIRFRNLAARHGAPFCIIRTTCPDKVVKQRLDERNRNPEEISDGRWELLPRQKDEFEAPESEEGILINLDTSRPVHDNIDVILNVLEIHHGA